MNQLKEFNDLLNNPRMASRHNWEVFRDIEYQKMIYNSKMRTVKQLLAEVEPLDIPLHTIPFKDRPKEHKKLSKEEFLL